MLQFTFIKFNNVFFILRKKIKQKKMYFKVKLLKWKELNPFMEDV